MAVSPAQEEYLKRIRGGMQREAAAGVAKAERGFAARGLGRHIGSQAAVGGLAAQYAQRIGETVGGIRSRAAEATAGRQFQTGERVGGQQFRTGERVGGQQFVAGQEALGRIEAGKARSAAAEQSELNRQAQIKAIKESKKKTAWDYITGGVGMGTDIARTISSF